MKNKRTYLPKVSIIIPVYNGSNYLKEAIDSALNQDYPEVEVLVINDGSQDQGKTEAIAKSYGEQIRYFCKENGGVATALNYGIQMMSGEYFSWLSHDDLYKKNKISSQMEALNGQNDPTRIICCGYDVIDRDHNLLYTIDPVKEYGQENLEKPLFPVFRCCINGCGMLIHRSHFQRVGVFNPNLPTTQDYDLWFRILRGQSMCFLEGSYFYSRSHEEQDSRKLQEIHLQECNELWVRLFESLTVEEMTGMDGSSEAFYAREFLRFQETEYYQVQAFLQKKIIVMKLQPHDLLWDLEQELETLGKCYEQHIESLYEENHKKQQQILKLQKRYDDIVKSTCWKFTRPIRRGVDVAKKLRKIR